MDESKDHLERRCPRLGGPASFVYCRTSGDVDSVCWKVFDCWWEEFDVVGYMKNCLPEEHFNRLVHARPKPKMVSLMECIEQARKAVS